MNNLNNLNNSVDEMELSSSGSFQSSDDNFGEAERIQREANGYTEEKNAFQKQKIDVKVNPDTGMTEILIQDESFTLMQPLVMENLQSDPRILFAGYRTTHPLNNEILLKLKCVEGCPDAPEDCLRDSLQKLLKDLNHTENLCSSVSRY